MLLLSALLIAGDPAPAVASTSVPALSLLGLVLLAALLAVGARRLRYSVR
jgi:hypothetical protein